MPVTFKKACHFPVWGQVGMRQWQAKPRDSAWPNRLMSGEDYGQERTLARDAVAQHEGTAERPSFTRPEGSAIITFCGVAPTD